MEQIGLLTSQMGIMQKTIIEQGRKINAIEDSGQESCRSRSKSKTGGKSGNKISRVDEERERQFKLLVDSDKNNSDDKSEGESGDASDGQDMKGIRKKMTKKQRDKCSARVSKVLRKSETTYPEDDYETTESSGKDSDGGCKHSRANKVRSGAKVKKRPVKRRETWPHTIANEEDGDELTHENIGLAKFFTCYTHIQVRCRGVKARG